MNNLKLYNGFGGFNKTFDEYTILNCKTPVPWCNILSNSRFGTVISSYGTVYSFYKNASEFKLTSWCNDWINFTPGESFKGIFDDSYNLTYGFGYVNVSEDMYSIERNMNIFIPENDDVKIHYLTLNNNRLLDKEVTIEYSLDMVMGVAKEFTSRYVLAKIDEQSSDDASKKTLLLKNPFSEYFSDVVSYVKGIAFGDSKCDITYDVNQHKVIIRTAIKAGKSASLAILFGATSNGIDEIKRVCDKYSSEKELLQEFAKTKKYWRDKVIRNFKTGDKELDIMANGWLLYQTICCRIYARTAFYQARWSFWI